MPLRFGTARFDPDRRQLVRDGREQHLSPKAFDLLLALINARPAVLTKDELMALVWPDTFVSEANLAVLIGDVRAAIGDAARAPRFIRTHHAVGYSFVGEVTEVPASVGVPWSGPRAWLVIGERRVALPQGETIIGRDASADLPIPDASMSRRHARITVTGSQAVVEDLGSKNGTRVEGRRIDGPTPLGSRATVAFGTVSAEFLLEEPLESSTLTVRIDV